MPVDYSEADSEADLKLFRRMLDWLDKEEGRTLTLVSPNAEFDGPDQMMFFSTLDFAENSIFGETRAEIMDKIEKQIP